MIAFYGGSFAPLHNGHLRFAIEALEQLRPERVHLITSGLPPHRAEPTVSGPRRHAWVERVAATVPGLVADDDELAQPGPCYSVDTLRRAHARFGDVTLLWLMGTDAFNGLHRWHEWQTLFELAHIVVAARPGHTLAPHDEVRAFARAEVENLRSRSHGCWYTLPIPELDISSTGIRERIRARASLRGLIPDRLLDTLTAEDLADLAAYEDP